ncbi:MAG TPA: sodium:solute symporter family protein [Chlamydiales bacterium]|nr:sodium:solute symporter family protein [Chlamydiales bacterium]
MNVFIFSIMALQCLCWWIARRSSRDMSTQSDYYLGGKGFSFFPLMMTFFATQVGGGIVLGASEEAFSWGWWVLFYPIGQVLGLIGLGAGIGKRLASYRVSTVAQIFEVFYDSPFLKRAASLLSILSLFMILIAQILASKKFMLSLGVDTLWIFYLFWGLLIAYTALGGIRAVVATDMIQAGVLIFFLFTAFFYAFWTQPPIALPETDFSPSKISGWLFMPFLFSFIEQDMGQRCFAAQSNRILSKATLGAALLTFFIAFIPIYFGITGMQLGLDRTSGGSILMAAVSHTTTPALTALVGCAVLAAILSTADSLINAIGSNLSQDFFRTSSLKTTKLLSIAIGAGALFSSSYFTNVLDLLIQSYEFTIAALIVPLLAALFQKRKGNLRSALIAAIFGASGFILFRLIPCPIPTDLAEIALSLLGYTASEALFAFKLRRAEIPTH